MTAAVAKATADPHLIENLRQLIGAKRVITDPSQRSYYSTDLSAYPAVTAAAVIQPGSVEELAQAVKLIAAAGYALIPRGGGMSYTKGYVPERPESVLVDMRQFASHRIVPHSDKRPGIQSRLTRSRPNHTSRADHLARHSQIIVRRLRSLGMLLCIEVLICWAVAPIEEALRLLVKRVATFLQVHQMGPTAYLHVPLYRCRP